MDRSHLYSITGGDLIFPSNVLIEIMREVLGKGLPFRFCARGSSMFPYVKNGDIITVAPFENIHAPKLGDIVAYVHPESEKLIVHRVLKKKSESFIIKGDNIFHKIDGDISRENLLGKVVSLERNGKNVGIGLGYGCKLIAIFSRLATSAPFNHILKKLFQLHRWLS